MLPVPDYCRVSEFLLNTTPSLLPIPGHPAETLHYHHIPSSSRKVEPPVWFVYVMRGGWRRRFVRALLSVRSPTSCRHMDGAVIVLCRHYMKVVIAQPPQCARWCPACAGNVSYGEGVRKAYTPKALGGDQTGTGLEKRQKPYNPGGELTV